nr:MAG TPA: hypothetical protein [Caudoviricetes sp.]
MSCIANSLTNYILNLYLYTSTNLCLCVGFFSTYRVTFFGS